MLLFLSENQEKTINHNKHITTSKMIVFASIEGPPLSNFELGLESEIANEAKQFFAGGTILSDSPLTSTLRTGTLVLTVSILCVQIFKMKTFVMKSRKVV